MPHPFDRFRGSLCATPGSSGWPGRSTGSRPTTRGSRSARATSSPPSSRVEHGLPGIAVSDAHSAFEVGVAYTVLDGDPSTAAASSPRCPTAELVTGRASIYVRLLTPLAKVVQRARGNGRIAADRRRRRGGPDERAAERRRAPVRPDDRAATSGAIVRTDADRERRPPTPARAARRAPIGRRSASAERHVSADQLSLGRRLRQPRTIVSLVLPLILLVFFARALPGFKLDQLPGLILQANPLLLLAAFVVFYAGFPLRGLRWAILHPRAPGSRSGSRDATEIIFIWWLVNCLVPAKLGDLYRAYLLKINSTVSLSPDVRDRVHRADPRPVRDRGARPRGGLLELPRTGCRPRSRSCSRSASASSSCSPAGLLTMRNFGRRMITAAAAAASGDRVLRPVRGGRLRRPSGCGRCRGLDRPDRPDLGDRGDAPLPRRRGARVPGRPARASAARSSSP